jgi:hypothetical protein
MDGTLEAAPVLRLVSGGVTSTGLSQADQSATRKHGSAFKQANFVRAVRAARTAGLSVVASVISPDGTIRLEHVGAPAESAPKNPFDRWEEKRARAA